MARLALFINIKHFVRAALSSSSIISTYNSYTNINDHIPLVSGRYIISSFTYIKPRLKAQS